VPALWGPWGISLASYLLALACTSDTSPTGSIAGAWLEQRVLSLWSAVLESLCLVGGGHNLETDSWPLPGFYLVTCLWLTPTTTTCLCLHHTTEHICTLKKCSLGWDVTKKPDFFTESKDLQSTPHSGEAGVCVHEPWVPPLASHSFEHRAFPDNSNPPLPSDPNLSFPGA
jgi:hypothetical protein